MVPTHKAFVFGELLRGFRERFGISQQELATELGKHRNTISQWEREGCPKDRDEVCRLESALQLSKSELDLLLYAAGYALEYNSFTADASLAVGTESGLHHQTGYPPSSDRSLQPYGYLHVKNGTDDDKPYVLKRATLLIGRDPTKCDFAIPDKFERASRVHAAITWERNNAYLEDKESKNGTFVDGERITERIQLQPGQVILLGGRSARAEVCVLEFSLLPYPTK